MGINVEDVWLVNLIPKEKRNTQSNKAHTNENQDIILVELLRIRQHSYL